MTVAASARPFLATTITVRIVVVPPPTLSASIIGHNGAVRLEFPGFAGTLNRVQFKLSLTPLGCVAVGRFPEPGDEELLAGPARNFQVFDPLDFLAEVTQHIPEPGMFRITSQGATANSGFSFRANPPADDLDGFPRGYEAQICNSGDAYTGWLWKPGKPTGNATELLTKDGEWFSYRIRAVGGHIQFWISDKLEMTYDDAEYRIGHLAIQGHNPGMTVEAKELYYLDLGK